MYLLETRGTDFKKGRARYKRLADLSSGLATMVKQGRIEETTLCSASSKNVEQKLSPLLPALASRSPQCASDTFFGGRLLPHFFCCFERHRRCCRLSLLFH